VLGTPDKREWPEGIFPLSQKQLDVRFAKELLHNGGFCNGCITKRILLLQAFHSSENQYYADYDKKYYN
jgi:hypothetical protein